MALYLYHFDVLEEVDVISILAGSFIYYSIPYVCFTYACSSYFILLEFWSCLVRIRGRVRLCLYELSPIRSGACVHPSWDVGVKGLRAYIRVNPLYRRSDFGFYLCLLSRVSPTNKRTSDLIYPTDPSRICVECVIELLHLGCVAWNSRSSPSSDRDSLWLRVEEFI